MYSIPHPLHTVATSGTTHAGAVEMAVKVDDTDAKLSSRSEGFVRKV